MKYLRLFDTHADYQDFTETQEFILPNVSRCRASNDVHYNPIPETRLIVTYSIVDDGGGNIALNLAKGGTQLRSGSTVQAKLFNWWDVAAYESEYGAGTSPFSDIKASDIFDKIEWNGEEIDPADLDDAQGYAPLPTGTQVIKYTLSDPTTIPYGLFSNYGYYSSGGDDIARGETRSLGQQSSIIKVEIPNNVTTIEGMAFANNSDLTTIKFGTGIEAIEDYAFCSCGDNDFDNATSQAFDDLYDVGKITDDVFSCPDDSGGDTPEIAAVNSSSD